MSTIAEQDLSSLGCVGRVRIRQLPAVRLGEAGDELGPCARQLLDRNARIADVRTVRVKFGFAKSCFCSSSRAMVLVRRS